MKKTVLTFGLLSGAIVSIMMLITFPFHDQIGFDRGEIIGYTSMLAAFLLIYFGIRSYRDNVAGGSVGFGRAFKVGALIALVTALMYTATWEAINFTVKPDFLAKYQAHEMEKMRAAGATQAELDAKTRSNATIAKYYANPVLNAAMTMAEILPLGIVVAAVSAGVASRRRRTGGMATTAA